MHSRSVCSGQAAGWHNRLQQQPRGPLHPQLTLRLQPQLPFVVEPRQHCPPRSSAGYEPTGGSIEYLQQQTELQNVRRLQQLRQPIAGQLSGEETDLLWAGYSALEEQLTRQHRRHEALAAQLQDLQAKLHAAQQRSPASTWQAATFLMGFLLVINWLGMLAKFQMGWMLPWSAAKASAGSLWLKQVLTVALPFTNTAVLLIFCVQAIRAAWTCIRW